MSLSSVSVILSGPRLCTLKLQLCLEAEWMLRACVHRRFIRVGRAPLLFGASPGS
jgi:hypothetical protein